MDNEPRYSFIEIEKLCKTIPIPTIVINQEKLLLANKAFSQMLGYTEDEILRTKFWDRTIDGEAGYYQKAIQMFLDDEFIEVSDKLKIRSKSNEIFWLNFAYKKILVDGKLNLLVTFNDISDDKLQEKKLKKYVSIRQSMLELTQKMMGNHSLKDIYEIIMNVAVESIEGVDFGSLMMVDGNDMRVVACKGFESESLIGFVLPRNETFIHQITKGKFDKSVLINNLSESEEIKFLYLPDDIKSIKSTISSPIYIDNKLFGLVNVDSSKKNQFTEDDLVTMDFIRTNLAIGIKQHFNINEKVYLSRYDGLTDIYNRSHFERIVIQKLETISEKEKVFLVMFDLDNLKYINDNYGHMSGDMMITYFAEGLKSIKKNKDILGRYGGDEFIGVFYRINEEELVHEFEKLKERLIYNPIEYNGNLIKTSFSYGYASFGDDSIRYRKLVRKADANMYEYKSKNKQML